MNFLLNGDESDVLDIIDCSFQSLDARVRKAFPREYTPEMEADDAIEELNDRFQQHELPYRFEGGQLIRADSEYTYQEVTAPAIRLLQTEGFTGAEEEFLKAHEHYREGGDEDAITWALKALESTLKTICFERGWDHDSDVNCKDLLDIIFENDLIPGYLQSHYGGLRAVLESGVPTARNKDAAHGQGPEPREVPSYLSAYNLHLTGSAILFLVRAHREG